MLNLKVEAILMIMVIHFILLSVLFGIAISTDDHLPHRCLEQERSALWEFKQSFITDTNSETVFASWKLEGEGSDCCSSWNGVECDVQSGHVTGLDLSSNSLLGSISSNSSLFRLLRLQKLNLAYNEFNYSLIPAAIGNLSSLTHLNLSQSTFAGQVPSQILQLLNLSSLDLSENGFLELKKPDLRSLVQTLTKLEHIHLSSIDMSGSKVPDVLSNYSSLQSLRLDSCRLHGEFPTGIFQLPNLKLLDLSYNTNLSFSFPDDINSPLERLYLTRTNLTGMLPFSLGKLVNLTRLYLPYNNLIGEIPSSFANLTRLVFLSLDENMLTGAIPGGILNLPVLESLDLAKNQLSGLVPSVLVNDTKLTQLDLSSNNLQGPIPPSIFNLKNLRTLHLGFNNLTGSMQLQQFLALKDLTSLDLSFNHLVLLTETDLNLTALQFQELFLASCNLTIFPKFLRHQQDLQVLDLSSNNIHGQIPEWVMDISAESLFFLNLSNNFLTGFQKQPAVFSSVSLNTLDLSSNLLEGPLPIPPISVTYYMASSNKLSGDIPARTFCGLPDLQALDLSFNNLTGMIPTCLSSSLRILNLRRNSFNGSIPENFTSGCSLQMIDLSENQLHGRLPRSLTNCAQLEFLAVANNQFMDTFPNWLGSLEELSVLILRANRFHGSIGEPESDSEFSKLRIIDISNNAFTGKLPSSYFSLLHSMEAENLEGEVGYMEQFLIGYPHLYAFYAFSLTMQNKGTETDYQKILNILVAMDLSSNRFEGEIPELIGKLKGIHSLNLSNNILTGHIPKSLGDLRELESLDLSSNALSGEIPQELVQLSFLAVFNVSNNQLTGSVPQGQQFDTFQDSYNGNPGLCGDLLSKKCRISGAEAPSASDDDQDYSDSWIEFDWKVTLAGYGGGLVVGVIGGSMISSRKQEWFVRILQRRKQKSKRKTTK